MRYLIRAYFNLQPYSRGRKPMLSVVSIRLEGSSVKPADHRNDSIATRSIVCELRDTTCEQMHVNNC
jgi:hypothetical protein